METKIIFNKKSLETFNYFLLIAIVATFPFSIRTQVNSFLIILLIANWLLQVRFKPQSKSTYFFIAFYFLYAIGIIFSSNTSQGFFELEKKLSFLIFPLILSSIPELSKKQIKNIFLGFVISCFLVSLVCIIYAVYQFLFYNDSHYFSYHPLVEIIGMHAIYMSMYVCLCVFIIVDFYGNILLDKTSSLKKRILILLSITYFIVFLFLLSARAEISAFLLIGFTCIVFYAFKKKKLLQALGLIVFLMLFFSALIYFNPQNRERFKEAINYKSQYSIDKQWGGRAERILMWDCSLDIIKENLLFGVGTGDSQVELNKCYTTKNYGALLYYKDTQYNAHNQFFQTTIDIGIFGLIILLICFFVVVVDSINSKNYLGLSFILLFAICCLTESMLESNKGIVFYSFFSSFFLFHNYKKAR